MVDRKQPKPPAQPAEAALTPVQKAAAIKTYWRVRPNRSRTVPRSRERPDRPEPEKSTVRSKALWYKLRVGYTRAAAAMTEEAQREQMAADKTGGRASRAGGESSRLDYKETRTRKRGRPDDPANVDMPKKRRESTTRVAEIGIGLYQWMKHVGDQALEWRRGIG